MKVVRSFSNKNWRSIGLCCIIALVAGCDLSFSQIELHRGDLAAEKKEFKKSVDHYRRVVRRSPGTKDALVAAESAAQISKFDLKDYRAAIEFRRYQVEYGATERDRRSAQKEIAQTLFENLNDYPAAIIEFNKLLVLRNEPGDEVELRYQLAKAHFYLNQFFEAKGEVEAAIKLVSDEVRRFDLYVFLGNILFNTKQTDAAAAVFEMLIKQNPERAIHENIVMNAVVCYEELQQFDRAMARLESIRSTYPDKDFIDLKIKRLKQRKANMPGARGFRK